MEFYAGGRSSGKTYTLELAMFGQEVLNEMSDPSHGSEKQTDVIYELINKYPLVKAEHKRIWERR